MKSVDSTLIRERFTGWQQGDLQREREREREGPGSARWKRLSIPSKKSIAANDLSSNRLHRECSVHLIRFSSFFKMGFTNPMHTCRHERMVNKSITHPIHSEERTRD